MIFVIGTFGPAVGPGGGVGRGVSVGPGVGDGPVGRGVLVAGTGVAVGTGVGGTAVGARWFGIAGTHRRFVGVPVGLAADVALASGVALGAVGAVVADGTGCAVLVASGGGVFGTDGRQAARRANPPSAARRSRRRREVVTANERGFSVAAPDRGKQAPGRIGRRVGRVVRRHLR